ncbi:aminoglycoside adenylyltransferase domain-containing protein [Rhodococcus sp. HNM0569]|uniref:aminoglycoside adenylyltransferase domain-containing protein n=1 Tax=Rhodococcus sp. HNM0569 TaxID=2716340 RepID=UPI001469A0AF|nr:aminoglycoside adenylyltransferase domain-containing protein [Rhodococcus sp. HNM0569]NLU82537.1 DUF4111 domain-containing protein [Rhodococcus sp. HNM0569]
MDELPAPVLAHLDRHDPGGVVGIYLYGSAVSGGLRPDSDVDLLVVTRRSLDSAERTGLVQVLLDNSGWRGHADRFPDAASRRPLDVTFLVLGELSPMTARPRRDFQYGEWLRDALLGGVLPEPADDPDVALLLATALHRSRTLEGPRLAEIVPPVSAEVLRQASLQQVPRLVDEIAEDTRNVLLTLCRILVTLESGAIVSKDVAAQAVASRRSGHERALLHRARAAYLGFAREEPPAAPHAHALAQTLVDEIIRLGDGTITAPDSPDLP